MLTSASLVPGKVYSRAELRELFGITDATINTGVFMPKGYESIWLFITQNKSKDRTQYKDQLIGDVLFWESQPSAAKDHFIVEHQRRGLEVLVFYRKKKGEFPHAAFRYFGPFRYITHTGSRPQRFVLERIGAEASPCRYCPILQTVCGKALGESTPSSPPRPLS